MLQAVRREGRALQFASEELSDDKELVLEARRRHARQRRRGMRRGAPSVRRGGAADAPRARSPGCVREQPVPPRR